MTHCQCNRQISSNHCLWTSSLGSVIDLLPSLVAPKCSSWIVLGWWMNVDEHGREKTVARRGGFWEGKQEQILWSLRMPQIHLSTKGIFLQLYFVKFLWFHFKAELQSKRCVWSLWCQPHYPWNKIIKSSSIPVLIPYTWRQLERVNLVITLIMHRSTKEQSQP